LLHGVLNGLEHARFVELDEAARAQRLHHPLHLVVDALLVVGRLLLGEEEGQCDPVALNQWQEQVAQE